MALLTNNSVSDFGIPLPENIFVKENNKYVPTEDGIKFLQQYIKAGGTYSALSREINISATTIAFNCKKLGLQNGRFLSSFVGTKETLQYIENYFGYTNISISKEHAKRSATEIYSIKFSEGKTLEMLNHLYDDNITDICMKRKYDKYLSLVTDN